MTNVSPTLGAAETALSLAPTSPLLVRVDGSIHIDRTTTSSTLLCALREALTFEAASNDGSRPTTVSLLTESEREWTLPRGAIYLLRQLAANESQPLQIVDERVDPGPTLSGIATPALRDYQQQAVARLQQYTQGSVVVPCGGGKCVSTESLVFTSRGLLRMGELLRNVAPETASPLKLAVDTATCSADTNAVYNGGEAATIRIQLEHGYEIEVTPEHPLRVLDPGPVWRRADQLRVGDRVQLRSGSSVATEDEQAHRAPSRFGDLERATLDIRWLLARTLSCTADNRARMCLADNGSRGAIVRWGQLHRMFTAEGTSDLALSTVYDRLLKWAGVDVGSSPGIPRLIRRGSRKILVSFIDALFHFSSTLDRRAQRLIWTTHSERLAREVQVALLSLGVVTHRLKNGPHWQLSISDLQRLNHLGFRAGMSLASRATGRTYGEPEHARTLGLAIESLTPSRATVGDLSVPVEHQFVANGIVCHNTRIGLGAIATLARPAIILVHTLDLAEQWKGEVQRQLGLSPGSIGAGQESIEPVTIAVLQTLVRWDRARLDTLFRNFGLVILDEAHHVPATMFRSIVSRCPARFRLGLTATPDREDQLTPVLHQTMGNVLLEITHDQLIAAGVLTVPEILHVRTQFSFPYLCRDDYNGMITALVRDPARNRLIAQHIGQAVRAGHTVLVLSGRLDHCRELQQILATHESVHAELLIGEVSTERRKRILEGARSGDVRVIVATSVADEGLDLPRLSRVFLTFPSRAAGRSIQRLGRLMRPHPEKLPAALVDFVDHTISVLLRQARVRAREFARVLGTRNALRLRHLTR